MRLRYRIHALIIAVAMLSSILTGCDATGSSSPEALVKRVMHAVFAVDGEEVMDCILPELSAAYRLSRQLTMQLTGEDPELEIMEDFLDSLSVTYNIKKEEISSANPSTYVISKQQNDNTAVVRTLITLEINDQFDYCECYVQTMRINGKWYMSSILTSSPAGYKPNTVKLTDDELNQIKAGLDGNKLEYDPTAMRALNDLTIGDIPITSEVMQATWDVIDGYTKGKQPRIEQFVNDGESTGLLFEIFVEEYQNSPNLQAGVATTEVINAVVSFPADIISSFFGDMDSAPIIKMFDSDAKVAQIIIDFLMSYDFAAAAVSKEDLVVSVELDQEITSWYDELFKIIQLDYEERKLITKDQIEELKKEYERILTKNDMWDEQLWDSIEVAITKHDADNSNLGFGFGAMYDDYTDILRNIPIKIKKQPDLPYQTAKLGDFYKINEDTVDDIAAYMTELFETDPQNGMFDAMANEIAEYIDIEFMYDVNDYTSSKTTHKIKQKVTDEINSAKNNIKNKEVEAERLGKDSKIAAWAGHFIDFAGAAFAGMDAYNQFYKCGLVLDEFEVELKEILEYSGCDNAEAIIDEVIDELTSAVAKGGFKIVGEAFRNSYATTYLNKGIEFLLEESGKTICGAPVKVATMIFEIAWNTASFLGNYSQAHLQVWGVEDLYRDFNATKSELRTAMWGFYTLPTDENFKKLYYTYEYYALLVRAGSRKVSDLLCADAESVNRKFTNFVTGLFDGVDVDFRLQDIEYFKSIPEKDETQLYNFKSRLFPAM